jgi:nicotinate-nucleotide adenylyltransferase
MTIAYFGGCFDPFHNGHLNIARDLVDHLDIKNLKILPTGQPPHKDRFSISHEHRLNMIKIGIGKDLHRISIEDYEMRSIGASYSVKTFKYLREKFGSEVSIILCIGEDAFESINTWYNWRELLNYCHLAVVSRKDFKPNRDEEITDWLKEKRCENITSLKKRAFGNIYFCNLSQLKISSNEIRKNIKLGKKFDALVPSKIRHYINEHHLYRDIK